MNHDRLTVYKNFTFEASHVLPRHPGKCSRLHGHSWKLTVGVSGLVNKESGFVVDYNVLSEAVKAHVINNVDHMHLGQGTATMSTTSFMRPIFGEDFYPSSEHLVLQFAKILQPVIDEIDSRDWAGSRPRSMWLEEVSLEETCTCKATWRRGYGNV